MIRRFSRSHKTFTASKRDSALLGEVPTFEDSVSGSDLLALEERLRAILTREPGEEAAARAVYDSACAPVEEAIQAIRDLWDHAEAIYDAVEERAAEVDESILEAGQGVAAANAHAAKADAVVAGVYSFFDYIDGAKADPMLLTIARVERENLLRTCEAWSKHET